MKPSRVHAKLHYGCKLNIVEFDQGYEKEGGKEPHSLTSESKTLSLSALLPTVQWPVTIVIVRCLAIPFRDSLTEAIENPMSCNMLEVANYLLSLDSSYTMQFPIMSVSPGTHYNLILKL